MQAIKILVSTIDSADNAGRLASRLVEEGLAACVNIIPEVSSVYKWKGKVERAGEWLLLIKTPEDRVKKASRRIHELHPYEVPEILVLSVEEGYRPYLDWVIAETR